MNYRLAIFDLDGTLASSLDAIADCMTDALVAFGVPPPSRDAVRATVGLTLEDSITRLTNGRLARHQLPQAVEFYRELHETKGLALVRLFDGAGKLLEELPSHGLKSVLVSNKGRRALDQLLERLKIWAFFDLTLSAEDADCHKPDPKLFAKHIAPHFAEIPKQEILVVGDTETDIKFAKAAGLASCWVKYGYGDAAKCGKLKPDHEVADIRELRYALWGGKT